MFHRDVNGFEGKQSLFYMRGHPWSGVRAFFKVLALSFGWDGSRYTKLDDLNPHIQIALKYSPVGALQGGLWRFSTCVYCGSRRTLLWSAESSSGLRIVYILITQVKNIFFPCSDIRIMFK